ncbi:uncharacterized protein LOC127283435 isoform X3 [Leptopilina boulardi]|uniref:uncharacterized protein LOC127283435 isoform X3 n=1 Tax=Leptopilina boulardi TaxID=63433 RepID=UPI0021F62A83|nr:uncharacterized protein LOC127283435 isoform X3 [Leptopilina boulardi]
MSSIEFLPLLEGTKFIIIDEGLDAPFAETLITGWLKMFEKRRCDCEIDKEWNIIFKLLDMIQLL